MIHDVRSVTKHAMVCRMEGIRSLELEAALVATFWGTVPEAGVCDETCVLALAVPVDAAVELSTVQVSSVSSLFTTRGSLRFSGFLLTVAGCGVSGAEGLPLWWTWMCVE